MANVCISPDGPGLKTIAAVRFPHPINTGGLETLLYRTPAKPIIKHALVRVVEFSPIRIEIGHHDPPPPPPPKYALYGPGLPATPPGKPRKMPGFWGHPEVDYTELFCQNKPYLSPNLDRHNGRFFHFRHTLARSKGDRPPEGHSGRFSRGS